MSARAFWAVLLLTVLLITGCGSLAQQPTQAGFYQTVTESEWGIELALNRDGSAIVEIASWMPGESENAKVERHAGTWSASGATVALRLAAGEVIFTFVRQLSFAAFGKEGSAQGLEGRTATFEPKLFVKRKLWLVSELQKIDWEVD